MRVFSLILFCCQIVLKVLFFFLNHIHWLTIEELLTCTWDRVRFQTINKSHRALRILLIWNSINVNIGWLSLRLNNRRGSLVLKLRLRRRISLDLSKSLRVSLHHYSSLLYQFKSFSFQGLLLWIRTHIFNFRINSSWLLLLLRSKRKLISFCGRFSSSWSLELLCNSLLHHLLTGVSIV
jgi:hypothetical protein